MERIKITVSKEIYDLVRKYKRTRERVAHHHNIVTWHENEIKEIRKEIQEAVGFEAYMLMVNGEVEVAKEDE